MQIKSFSSQKGFTLVEILISIALFSVVLTVTLGTIITITDANKKARSLMSVMNNLNFAVDSVTRSFKTGKVDGGSGIGPVTRDGECLETLEIDYNESEDNDDFISRPVIYCFDKDGERGFLSKNGAALTSEDVDIDFLEFKVYAWEKNFYQQPLANIVIYGTVKVSEKIRSSFSIQTSVSQRQLNI